VFSELISGGRVQQLVLEEIFTSNMLATFLFVSGEACVYCKKIWKDSFVNAHLNIKMLKSIKIISNHFYTSCCFELKANVLTGLVNLSVDTLFASTSVAYGILVAYLLVLVIGMGLLRTMGIKIKF
jgi:hypothetical protein